MNQTTEFLISHGGLFLFLLVLVEQSGLPLPAAPFQPASKAGGGGKRDGHSYEYYDRETGIAVFTSPSVKPGAYFLYFDPLRMLDEVQQERWQMASERKKIIDAALDAAAVKPVPRQSRELIS